MFSTIWYVLNIKKTMVQICQGLFGTLENPADQEQAHSVFEQKRSKFLIVTFTVTDASTSGAVRLKRVHTKMLVSS